MEPEDFLEEKHPELMEFIGDNFYKWKIVFKVMQEFADLKTEALKLKIQALETRIETMKHPF